MPYYFGISMEEKGLDCNLSIFIISLHLFIRLFTLSKILSFAMHSSNKGSQRPLSPHLTIYKIQWSSALSILHRLSGLVLFFGLGCLALLWVYGSYNTGMWPNIELLIGRKIAWLLVTLLILTMAMLLCYHFINGIRFLYLDYTTRIDKGLIAKSGYIVMGITVTLILSLLLVFFNAFR